MLFLYSYYMMANKEYYVKQDGETLHGKHDGYIS